MVKMNSFRLMLFSISFFIAQIISVAPIRALEIGAATCPNNSIAQKGHNQDRFQIKQFQDGMYFFGIYDGHGALEALHSAGGIPIASQILADNLHAHTRALFEHSEQKGNMAGSLREGFRQLGHMIMAQPVFTGSTAATALLHNNTLVVANVGDSRVLLCREGGGGGGGGEFEIRQLSIDHDLGNYNERERIRQIVEDIEEREGEEGLKGVLGVIDAYTIDAYTNDAFEDYKLCSGELPDAT